MHPFSRSKDKSAECPLWPATSGFVAPSPHVGRPFAAARQLAYSVMVEITVGQVAGIIAALIVVGMQSLVRLTPF